MAIKYLISGGVLISILSLGCASAPPPQVYYPGAAAETAKSAIPSPASTSEATTEMETQKIADALKNISAKKKSDYKIRHADLLDISVYREEDLTRTVRITSQGTISLPLAGVVRVGGLSVLEAEQSISTKLKEFLVDPQVTIFIKEYGNKQIYVLGEVKSPGSFDLPTENTLTVLEAISQAGGFSGIAAKDRTSVIRETEDGKSINITIEVSAIMKNGEKHKDISLQPNDVIYVPQSYF